jgi:hypothetical protein
VLGVAFHIAAEVACRSPEAAFHIAAEVACRSPEASFYIAAEVGCRSPEAALRNLGAEAAGRICPSSNLSWRLAAEGNS